ncbi:HemK2/MTQ2 family protein methyltransferase [Streptomyces sp. RPT161]|uniref:HemK2/MTQ2 family protein methyltransferase n=1 Tax=Streptomyces sp. RPT161 TaxID=3015993 RepID=UPI0022B8F308|nr:HemK2/MTQ2 family protein methyltransferase [Streptomyces sp. RPT161]
MRVVRLPGVYPVQEDSLLLLGAVLRESPPARNVLELCTGSGGLAVVLARAGARVTAVDVSRRAVLSTRLNAQLNGVPVKVRREDVFAPGLGRSLGRYDVVIANPPYVPGRRALPAGHGRARVWDAGWDGRAVLDRICACVPDLLLPGGRVMLVQSRVANPDATCAALQAWGLATRVVRRRRIPFGPVMHERAPWLEQRGLIEPGSREEELVVIRGERARE